MIKTIPDHRGTFNILKGKNFDQIFISKSDKKFTFRGMHYQTDPYQIKTLKIIQGSAIDFIYNIETKDVIKFELTDKSDQLTIGPNFAHGFLTLEPNTIALYGVEGKFNPDTYTNIPYHTIPKIKEIVNETVVEGLITISEKDNIGS